MVVFDRTAGTGADLLAAVEKTGAEVTVHAADNDGLSAAVLALSGHAGQAGEGFGDTDVGELADIFGGDDFGDERLLLLDLGGGGETATEAGRDFEFVETHNLIGFGGGFVGFGRSGFGGGGSGRCSLGRYDKGRLGKQQAGGQASGEESAHGMG